MGGELGDAFCFPGMRTYRPVLHGATMEKALDIALGKTQLEP